MRDLGQHPGRCHDRGTALRWDRYVAFADCSSCKRDQRERNPTFVAADALETERELYRFLFRETPDSAAATPLQIAERCDLP
jgi:hypothetical protein